MAERATEKCIPCTTLEVIKERIKHLSQGDDVYSVMFAGECNGAVKILIAPKDSGVVLQSWEIWSAAMRFLNRILDGFMFERTVRQSRTLCNCTLQMV